MNETVPLDHLPPLPAGYQVKVWIPQMGQLGLFPSQEMLFLLQRSGLEIPPGEDLVPCGQAMSPALHEEPSEKGIIA